MKYQSVFGVVVLMSMYAIVCTVTSAHADEIRGLGNKCIDIQGGKASNGAVLQLYRCQGGSNQQWWYNSNSGEIRGLGNKCIQVCNDNSTLCRNLKNRLIINSCNGSSTQKWEYLSNSREIRNRANNGMCIEVQGGKSDDKTPIIWGKCDGGANQKWRFVN